MFIDYVRTCVPHIRLVNDVNTFQYCLTEKHKECPFYRAINKIGHVCEFVATCPIYREISIKDFDRFEKMVKNYCLSKEHCSCARYVVRKKKEVPPDNLLPDGGRYKG